MLLNKQLRGSLTKHEASLFFKLTFLGQMNGMDLDQSEIK